MKKNLKRLIALSLCVILTFSVALIGFAAKNISTTQAESIALADAGVTKKEVTMKKTKLERDDGRLLYEVEFIVSQNGYIIEYEYEINAQTGKIISRDKDYDRLIPENVARVYVKSVTGKTAVIAWERVREADGYLVYKYNTEKGTYKKVGTTKKLSYKISGLKPGKGYTYCVRAIIREDGQTGYSNQYTSVTFYTKTAHVKNVKAVSNKAGTVKVTWSASSGAEKYEVQCCRGSRFATGVNAKTLKKTAAAFSGLKKGAKYYVRVYAINRDGVKSAVSARVTVTVKK